MFDLESYAARYRGHGRTNRLLFVAERSPTLRLDAYHMAFNSIVRGKDVGLYKLVTSAVGGELGDSCKFDEGWLSAVEEHAAQQQEKLEGDLNLAKGALIKESIRMGHNDLGDFFADRGDLNSALKSYVRTRDYCTTQKHHIAMCLNVIRVSIELSNYAQVANYVTKAEQNLPPGNEDAMTPAKLRCASGLAHLDGKRYKLAAKQFVEVPAELRSSFNRVLSCEDVATFGGLCALASFDRTELKTLVIENNKFKSMLELTPRVRELVRDFYGSRYSSCLEYLEDLRPELDLCLFLHSHVNELYKLIRRRALIQYVSTYTSVDLRRMATSFNVKEVSALEKELAELIITNNIQARIDSHNKILFARHADQRSITFRKAPVMPYLFFSCIPLRRYAIFPDLICFQCRLEMGSNFARETRAMLLRMNLIKNGFVHDGPARSTGVPGSSRVGAASLLDNVPTALSDTPTNATVSMDMDVADDVEMMETDEHDDSVRAPEPSVNESAAPQQGGGEGLVEVPRGPAH